MFSFLLCGLAGYNQQSANVTVNSKDKLSNLLSDINTPSFDVIAHKMLWISMIYRWRDMICGIAV